jgi:choline dehydrogenase-like flavoprotein
MSQPEQFDILVLGSGKSGKLLAWHMAQSARRLALLSAAIVPVYDQD